MRKTSNELTSSNNNIRHKPNNELLYAIISYNTSLTHAKYKLTKQTQLKTKEGVKASTSMGHYQYTVKTQQNQRKSQQLKKITTNVKGANQQRDQLHIYRNR